MPDQPPRLLILAAHPDDAEYHAGGLASMHRELGHVVEIVSLTNGGAGHHERRRAELASLRRDEAAAAGRVIGAVYQTWDIPDGELMPDLDTRRRVIAEIRTFQPDLVLTHRASDYHPDHRAAGQLVQDASYLVTVPGVLPEVPALSKDPVVAYMPDLFTRPVPMRPDVVLDVTERVDTIVAMLACHRSQVFEWLPYEEGILDQVPADETEKTAWLRGWYNHHMRPRADHFRDALIAAYGSPRGEQIEYAEVYEISQYAARMQPADRERLFPGGKWVQAQRATGG
jgi:LmbE family N-acetylglucosaminyl deacetylase